MVPRYKRTVEVFFVALVVCFRVFSRLRITKNLNSWGSRYPFFFSALFVLRVTFVTHKCSSNTSTALNHLESFNRRSISFKVIYSIILLRIDFRVTVNTRGANKSDNGEPILFAWMGRCSYIVSSVILINDDERETAARFTNRSSNRTIFGFIRLQSPPPSP